MLNVGQVIDRVKDEYADATEQIVPGPSLARHLSDYQRELMRKVFLVDDTFRAQQASIVFADDAENDPAIVGRGTSGGLPVLLNEDGSTYSIVRGRTGGLLRYNLDDAAALVNPRPVVAATANTLTAGGTAWVVDEFANKIVRITSGKGQGSAPRLVLSNTATILTASQNWEVQPDVTSMFEVLEATPETDQDLGVATSDEPTDERTGYLVREDANGVAYIDHAKPIRATFSAGIPLPPNLKVLGGDVRYAPSAGQATMPLNLAVNAYRGRSTNLSLPTAYVLNGDLFLSGITRYWNNVESIDLRYVPIPPKVYLDADLFLLDDAESPLVARGVWFAHKRALALKIESADPSGARAELDQAEVSYLAAKAGAQPAAVYKRRDTFSRRH